MTAITTIRMDGEAFAGCEGAEVARILRVLATQVEGIERFWAEDHLRMICLRDVNGNDVGGFAVRPGILPCR